MAHDAGAIASEARTRYEASLQQLRAFIAGYPSFKQRVDEHDERLDELESRFLKLRHEVSGVIAEAREWRSTSSNDFRADPKGDDAARSTVSFSADQAVWRYSHEELDAIIPSHGHWLPPCVIARRQSFDQARDFAKQLGGRMSIIQPEGIEGVDSMECVIVEPMGKILSPSEYVSTGLIVCIDGASHDSELVEEWGDVLKATKWLDSGISFALPDVSILAEACDLEHAVEAVLKLTGFRRCVLAGKGWGGQMVSEMAGRSRLSERIDGVILMAPESPAPAECSRIELPVLLLWAEDDEESPFSEIRDWVQILYDRRAPTLVKDVPSGGHVFSKVIKQTDAATQVLYFVISCILMNHLMQTLDEAGSSIKLTDAEHRLCDELPVFLAGQIGGDAELGVAAACTSSDPARIRRRMERLVSCLGEWIQEGLKEMASAKE